MLWRRLAATLIDAVATAVAVLYFLVLTWRITFLFVPLDARTLLFTLAVEGLVLIWGAFALLCPTVGQQTMDLQVVRPVDGTRPSLARRAFRASIIVLTGPVGLAVMLFDPKRRALWDLLSGTQVAVWEWEETGEDVKPDGRAILRRAVAYLIDDVIIAMLVVPTVIAAGQAFQPPALTAIWVYCSITYFALFIPTPGQRLMRLRAVTADGKPVGVLRRLGRGVLVGAMFLNFGTAFPLLLSSALMLASKQFLTPWDYVSRLRFVRETRTRKRTADEKPVSDTGGEWLENCGQTERGL